MHLSWKSTLGKVLKSIKVLKERQFIPISVRSFRGAVLVDLLNQIFLILHTDGWTDRHTDTQQSKSFTSLTPQEGDLSPPPPPTASLTLTSLPFPQSFDKSADKRVCAHLSGHPPLLEVSTSFIIYY